MFDDIPDFDEASHPMAGCFTFSPEVQAAERARLQKQAEKALKRYEPVKLERRRISGWTAERQRTFLSALADSGCVSTAAMMAEITPRSCYRLRCHPAAAAFAKAWDEALLTATGRLTAIAFERAIIGTPREVWRDGELVAQTSIPSDRMMMFLLQHLLPRTYGQRGPCDGSVEARIEQARAALPATLDTLTDIVEDDPEAALRDDYGPQPPREISA